MITGLEAHLPPTRDGGTLHIGRYLPIPKHRELRTRSYVRRR